MARIEIPNFQDYLEQLIGGSHRTIKLVSGRANELDIVYSLSNERVIAEENRSKTTVARILRVLVPGTLITGMDNLKEDTSCILSVNLVSVYSSQIIFNFEISVCNGSNMHKSRIRESEMQRISNRLSNINGFSVSKSSLSINIEKSCIYKDYNIKNLKDISFTGKKCVMEY